MAVQFQIMDEQIMDEHKPQTETQTPDQPNSGGIGVTAEDVPDPIAAQAAEDIRDSDVKIAEAGVGVPPPQTDGQLGQIWLEELKRFHEVVNDTLLSKEKLKIKAANSKVRAEFMRNWTSECNRHLVLAVNLRRRIKHVEQLSRSKPR